MFATNYSQNFNYWDRWLQLFYLKWGSKISFQIQKGVSKDQDDYMEI